MQREARLIEGGCTGQEIRPGCRRSYYAIIPGSRYHRRARLFGGTIADRIFPTMNIAFPLAIVDYDSVAGAFKIKKARRRPTLPP
jgi:hypothetical protein